MEFVRERSSCEMTCAREKSAPSFMPMNYLLTPRCTTSANLRFSRDLSILMYTSMIPGELSGKDLRRRHERRRLAATRRSWTCRSTVYRRPLPSAGVPGFKCFLIHPGTDGFTMVNEAELRAALPHVARTGLPLLVHAELPGPVDQATRRLRDADWRRYSTHLQSRPEEAELAAIRLLLSLCRQYKFRLHI